MTIWSQKLRDGSIVAKTTIRPTGETIGRNFNKDLKSGEVGVKIVLDLSKVDPDTDLEHGDIIAEALDAASMNIKKDAGLDVDRFSPGAIVDLEGEYAIVLRDNGEQLRLRLVNEDGILVRGTRSLSRIDAMEVPGYSGVAGLIQVLYEMESKLLPGFLDHYHDAKFLARIMQAGGEYCGCDTESPRCDTVDWILENAKPFEHFDSLMIAAGMEDHAVPIFDFARNSEDDRRNDLLAKIAISIKHDEDSWGDEDNAELAMAALTAIPDEQQDLLQMVALRAQSMLVRFAAIQRCQTTFEGSLDILCDLLSACVSKTDGFSHESLLPILRMLNAEDARIVIVETEFEKKSHFRWSMFCDYQKPVVGGSRSMSTAHLEDERLYWAKPEVIAEMRTLRVMADVPEAFWQQMEHGFDTVSTDPRSLLACLHTLKQPETMVAFAEHFCSEDRGEWLKSRALREKMDYVIRSQGDKNPELAKRAILMHRKLSYVLDEQVPFLREYTPVEVKATGIRAWMGTQTLSDIDRGFSQEIIALVDEEHAEWLQRVRMRDGFFHYQEAIDRRLRELGVEIESEELKIEEDTKTEAND